MHIQGCRSSGRAGGAAVGQGEQENILGQWKLMKNKAKSLPIMFASVHQQC